MGRRTLSRGLAAAVAASGSLFLAPAAAPIELVVTPSLSVEESWDTNIFNTSTDETSDFVTRVRPALMLTFPVLRTTMSVSGGFEWEKYLDHDELDAVTATQDITLGTAEPLQLTPRFSLRPVARYVETSDWVRRDVLTEAPTTELPSSESAVTARTDVTEISGILDAAYRATPKLELTAGGGARRREHDDPPGEDLSDSTVVTGSAGLGYRYSPRTTLGLFLEASHNSFEDDPSSDIYGGGVRGNYALAPNARIDGRLGVSYVEESAEPGGEKTQEWGPNVRLALSYEWPAVTAVLAGSYELAGGGSFGETTERGTLSISLINRLTELLALEIFGTVQSSTSIGEPETVDLMTADGRVVLRYRAKTWIFLTLSGNVFRQWADGAVGGDIERQAVALGFELRKPYRFVY